MTYAEKHLTCQDWFPYKSRLLSNLDLWKLSVTPSLIFWAVPLVKIRFGGKWVKSLILLGNLVIPCWRRIAPLTGGWGAKIRWRLSHWERPGFPPVQAAGRAV